MLWGRRKGPGSGDPRTPGRLGERQVRSWVGGKVKTLRMLCRDYMADRRGPSWYSEDASHREQ